MDLITTSNRKELELTYNQTSELAKEVEQVNDTLDAMEPMIDRLNNAIDLYKIKSKRLHGKMSKVMSKM